MKQKILKTVTRNEAIVTYIILVLCILISLKNPAFLDASTGISLSRAMLVTLIFALCEMVTIVSGGIDVSFPAVASLALYATSMLAVTLEINNVFLLFLVAGTIGLACGIINGLLIVKCKIYPLIATLGMSSVINGGTLAFIGTRELSSLPAGMDKLSRTFLFTYVNKQGISYSMTIFILVPIILSILVFLILRYTVLGRGIYAVGGDENAARIAGFNVSWIKYCVYGFSGLFAGIGGFIYVILMRQANPQVLMGEEMMVIAAVVIGGTKITGGYGTVIGTILGVGLIALVENNLIMLGVPSHFQTFMVGLIIVLGTSITALREKYGSKAVRRQKNHEDLD
ncbi:ABC transporter permease [Faecalicatena acetigenes]|uniref:ABC transporter permease n=1 Tax=Faecalicatena acetigenes TaxID=2981790 RepID=A0ABT2T8Z4_9FIRM|nr:MULTISPECIES: ABC transporter permease [Lachnospiraceae]MCU6746214.1 ABC transporter permease [Faecalicatena acetigenes]SCH01745.1 Ribose transport system permease protein rbsC [uncultured Clostridium sp.]